MIELQRHRAILEIVNIHERISVQEIVDRFSVSPATARRDLNKLTNLKQIKRVRSGAQALPQTHLETANKKLDTFALVNDKEKKIAQTAISLLQFGQTIAINNQDTAYLLARKICGQPYSVITNHFPLAEYLIAKNHTEVIVPGGQYQKSNATLCHPSESLNKFFCADHMFVCADGLTENGIYKLDIISGLYEKQMASMTSKLTVIFQKNTLNHSIGCKLFDLEKVHSIIVAGDVDSKITNLLINKDIKVIKV